MGNRGYWDEKFANRSDKLLNPEQSLVDNINYLKAGTVLDLACGDGRNAIYLAEEGFEVTGVDFSDEALRRLESFAQRSNLAVTTKQGDLSLDHALKDLGIYDNIIVNHYRLNKKQLEGIHQHLTVSGTLFICGFGEKHKVDQKIRKEDLIQPDNFSHISKTLELVKYEEKENDIDFFVTYIYRKKRA